MSQYIILFLIASLTSCGILDSDPKEPELEPGPRNYTWQVDTVANGPSGWLYDIWGSSPEDVWAVASSGLHQLWHYNGDKWEPYQEHNIVRAEAVFGFSQDNAWIGGGGGIYHFDGNIWERSYQYEKSGLYTSYITDIWGESSSDMYAVGTFYMSQEAMAQGFILHYNGKEWKEVLASDFGVQLQRVKVTNKQVFILGTKLSSSIAPDTMLIYRYSNSKLNEILSKTTDSVYSIWMNDVGDEIYYTLDNAILSFIDNEFKTFLSFPDRNDIVGVYGRHKKDVLILTRNEVLHYNRENVLPILEGLPRNVYRGQLFSEEVFFLVWDINNGTNLIYHGTLTEEEEE